MEDAAYQLLISGKGASKEILVFNVRKRATSNFKQILCGGIKINVHLSLRTKYVFDFALSK